jgi:hypothetical protein
VYFLELRGAVFLDRIRTAFNFRMRLGKPYALRAFLSVLCRILFLSCIEYPYLVNEPCLSFGITRLGIIPLLRNDLLFTHVLLTFIPDFLV